MVADAYHLGIQEVQAGASRDQIHPQLHEDFKISPGYWRPCLKTQRNPKTKRTPEEASLSLSFPAPDQTSSLPAVLCPLLEKPPHSCAWLVHTSTEQQERQRGERASQEERPHRQGSPSRQAAPWGCSPSLGSFLSERRTDVPETDLPNKMFK